MNKRVKSGRKADGDALSLTPLASPPSCLLGKFKLKFKFEARLHHYPVCVNQGGAHWNVDGGATYYPFDRLLFDLPSIYMGPCLSHDDISIGPCPPSQPHTILSPSGSIYNLHIILFHVLFAKKIKKLNLI